jgi:hypothetical protein
MPFYSHYNGAGWDTILGLGISGSNTAGTAQAINDSGLIAGYEYVSTVPTTASAYVWGTTAGSGVQLSTLVSNLGGWSLQEALGVDNSGDIVGLGVTAGGASDAFLLTPTPEPSTLLLTVSGLVGLLAYAWRKRK